MVRTLSWNCRRRGIEVSLLSPGIAILFGHSEWFQPLFAGLDRRGIPYDRLLAAELQPVVQVNLIQMRTHQFFTQLIRLSGNPFQPVLVMQSAEDRSANNLTIVG